MKMTPLLVSMSAPAARSLTVQQMSHRAPGVFELAHTKLAPYRTVFRAAGWRAAPYRRWLSSFSFALARTRRESPKFGICVVLRAPHPFGTCHALGALLVSWPKVQRVNWRQKRPCASSHFQMGGSILYKVSLPWLMSSRVM